MPTTSELIPVDEIVLDIGNPRIKQYIEMYRELNDAGMLLALGSSSDEEGGTTSMGSYERLKHSILASGGIIQPIIVKPISDNQYLCVEGNTRVAIYRQLRGEERATGQSGDRWDFIPAVVRADMDEEEAHKIRLQVHLVGNRQWNPYSKAKYLHELVEDYKMPIGELISYCGGSQSDIQQSIDAYRDMEAHYRPVLDDQVTDFDPRMFSAFMELQKHGIKDAIFEAGYSERDFGRWVYDKTISPLNSVRRLPQILDNPDTKNIFFKQGARDAINILNAPDLNSTLKESSIPQLVQALQEKINLLSYEDAQRIAGNSESDQYLDLKDLMGSIVELLDLEITVEN